MNLQQKLNNHQNFLCSLNKTIKLQTTYNFEFFLIGLGEEVGELLGQTKRYLSSGYLDVDKCILEAGDVLAYLLLAASEEAIELNIPNKDELLSRSLDFVDSNRRLFVITSHLLSLEIRTRKENKEIMQKILLELFCSCLAIPISLEEIIEQNEIKLKLKYK